MGCTAICHFPRAPSPEGDSCQNYQGTDSFDPEGLLWGTNPTNTFTWTERRAQLQKTASNLTSINRGLAGLINVPPRRCDIIKSQKAEQNNPKSKKDNQTLESSLLCHKKWWNNLQAIVAGKCKVQHNNGVFHSLYFLKRGIEGMDG